MTEWISWGFDTGRLGALTCVLTEAGGVTDVDIELDGLFMHLLPNGEVISQDPITGEELVGSVGDEAGSYENFGGALEDALNAAGDATYAVAFDPTVPGYTISASGGSVTSFALTSISTPLRRMLGITATSLSGALSYDCTEHAGDVARPLWHFTLLDIGISEWTELEDDIDGEDLRGGDGSVRGLVTVGTPRRLDFVVPWETAAKIWNENATADDWTWARAFARCRTIEPIWICRDPRSDVERAVVAVLRVDAAVLRPRLASADYLGHQGVPIGAWILGHASITPPALLLEDGSYLLLEDGSRLLME